MQCAWRYKSKVNPGHSWASGGHQVTQVNHPGSPRSTQVTAGHQVGITSPRLTTQVHPGQPRSQLGIRWASGDQGTMPLWHSPSSHCGSNLGTCGVHAGRQVIRVRCPYGTVPAHTAAAT
eukprot:1159097-Pelagomonas_calceolata.AAC.16